MWLHSCFYSSRHSQRSVRYRCPLLIGVIGRLVYTLVWEFLYCGSANLNMEPSASPRGLVLRRERLSHLTLLALGSCCICFIVTINRAEVWQIRRKFSLSRLTTVLPCIPFKGLGAPRCSLRLTRPLYQLLLQTVRYTIVL